MASGIDDPEMAVSTHSHPKAAADDTLDPLVHGVVSTHSHPKAAAGVICWVPVSMRSFQHTATRRRLLKWQKESIKAERVSTHSHPKAAASGFFTSPFSY